MEKSGPGRIYMEVAVGAAVAFALVALIGPAMRLAARKIVGENGREPWTNSLGQMTGSGIQYQLPNRDFFPSPELIRHSTESAAGSESATPGERSGE